LRRGLDDALLAFFKDKGIAVRNLES